MNKIDGLTIALFCWVSFSLQSSASGQAEGDGLPAALKGILGPKTASVTEEEEPGGAPAAGETQIPAEAATPPAEVDGSTPGGEEEGIGSLLKKGLGAVGAIADSIQGETDEEGQPAGTITVDENQGKIAELRRQAISNFEKKRMNETLRRIGDLITLKPYDAGYHLALGLGYRIEGRYQDALKKYEEVLELGGRKPLVALLRAEVYAAENDKEKAYAMLKEAALGGRNIINDVQNLPLLQPFQNETEFIKLALQLERFTVDRRGRHDPFTNPFPKVTEEDQGPADAPDIVLTAEEQQKLLREVKKIYEQIQFYIKIQDEKKAMAAYLELKQGLGRQKHLTIPKIINEFRGLEGRLQDIEVEIAGIRLRYYYGKATEKIDSMKELFKDGDYARVMAVHNQVAELVREMKSADKKKAFDRVGNEILAHSRRLVDRAKIRLEFENQKPNIQGIIIDGDSKATIINDRVIRQGESLAGVRVLKVESNRVVFRYKGEEIPLIFRRY